MVSPNINSFSCQNKPHWLFNLELDFGLAYTDLENSYNIGFFSIELRHQ